MAVLIAIVVGLGFSFLITAGLVAVICFAFSLAFTWKIALGVWAITILLGGLFKPNVTVKK